MKTDYQFLETIISNDVATIYLNRPEKGNILHIEMIRELHHCFSLLENIEKVRMVVIRGRGKHFCLGADLNWMKNASELSPEKNHEECMEFGRMYQSIFNSEKITISIVHGGCYGGGLGIIASCDFIYSASIATFAFGEGRLGLVPATISPYLTYRMGTPKSLQLMLTAEVLNASEALDSGIIDKIIPDAEAESAIEKLLTLLRKGNITAQRKVKKMMRQLDNPLINDDILNFLANTLAESRTSQEGQEGITAFLEKRSPQWKKDD